MSPIIASLSFVPLSDVESAFTLVIDEICQTADQFNIPTESLEKIDEFVSYFQKTHIKGQYSESNRRYRQSNPWKVLRT